MTNNDFTYRIPTIGLYNMQISCPHCESVITTAVNSPEIGYVKALEAQNARYRKALEKYANPETHSVDENGNVWYGDFFDYKTARDALEGKE